jgi:hypothetical protein
VNRLRQIGLLVSIVMLTACGNGMGRTGSTQADPCNAYTCDGPGAQLNVAYHYQLGTHCGVLEIRFDGRTFYIASLYPTDELAGLNQPVDVGTMVLLSSHVAAFRDPAGHDIRFVDTPPGVIGHAYPFTVHVLAGGNQLIDERFAGRLWHPHGTLPGVSGPPYGNGHDAYTAVSGSLTLLSADQAVFTTPSSSTVGFVRTSSACE